MNIAILTPTRQRPKMWARFINSIISNTNNLSNVYMYNYVDNDDPLVDEYRKLSFEGNVFLEIGKPIWLSTVWNNMCRKAIDNNADILIMGNDDLIYKTKNWDNILLDKLKDFSDDIYCAWFDDMIHNGTEEWPCAFPIISKTWFNILGRFTLERDGFCFNDAWNYHIAKMANRTKYIPEVVVEHAHWTTGKMKADETTLRLRSRERGNLFDKSWPIFNSTLQERIEDSKKLIEYMENFNE